MKGQLASCVVDALLSPVEIGPPPHVIVYWGHAWRGSVCTVSVNDLGQLDAKVSLCRKTRL